MLKDLPRAPSLSGRVGEKDHDKAEQCERVHRGQSNNAAARRFPRHQLRPCKNLKCLKFRRSAVYISIRRQDKREPWGEALVVRKVWWRFQHPETEGFGGRPKVCSLTEIFVECDVAGEKKNSASSMTL